VILKNQIDNQVWNVCYKQKA